MIPGNDLADLDYEWEHNWKPQEIPEKQKAKQKYAVCALSADPIHNGHLHNIIETLNTGLFDKVYVGIGNDCTKKYLFNTEERIYLAKKVLDSSLNEKDRKKIVLETIPDMLRNYAKEKGIEFIIRGCRNAKDLEYERVLADFNGEYGLKTLMFPASKKYPDLSSTYVKAVVKSGAITTYELVHPVVKQALEERVNGISIVGVTGNMGSGKSTFCKEFTEYSHSHGKEDISHLDLDQLIHSTYLEDSPLGKELREKIGESFGDDVFSKEKGKINRKKLSEIVFGDDEKRYKLAEILKIPLLVKLEEELKKRKGIVLIDAAYITEYNILPLVNYNTILIKCNEEERIKRIFKRDGMTKEEVEARTKAQHPYELKKQIILENQKTLNHGFFYEVNSENPDFKDILEKLNSSFPIFKTENKGGN